MTVVAAVVMALVACTVLGGVHWYLWRRLVRDVTRPGSRYRRLGGWALGALALLMVAAAGGGQLGLPFAAHRVLAWPGFLWMATLLYLLLALLVGEVVRFALLRRGRRRGAAEGPAAPEPEPAAAPVEEELAVAEPVPAGVAAGGAAPAPAGPPAEPAGPDGPAGPEAPVGGDADEGPGSGELSRRLLVSRSIAVGAGLLAAGTVGYGTVNARRLRVKRVTVPLARLPRGGHGYRIAVVSDIHLGPVLGGAHCRRVVNAINEVQPDAIAIVGDLVDAEVDDLRSAVAPLADLRSRDGAFFVTGNHEYYVETAEWIDHVRELGVTPLVNERRELPFLDLAGVNDVDGEGTEFGGPDYEAALGDRDPERASVLMAHQPVMIHEAVDHGVDLQLSGHTHGGQMWPITYVAALANPTLAGLERYGDTQLYVSRGAGAYGPPVRIGADPDITVVELASRQA
ncbi:metallophosphoesterase [Streptomyces sp. 3MP-14]|uniref:Metallophosphoesterase n=1 Tax=Streptomyces mimosae TaxID=2586635 RepID=A0A5N6ABK5_9ACTN|nr:MULTISPECIES: metallophosphoesterase [Streptomyces]KAB8165326.1 metallophosphoesterase [Streptomyces mimosae]KAB8175958.1 metallophosphoesterase [Streptomyces sp. 3MP-14]